MYIRKLNINNFKSFYGLNTITFSSGKTFIIGKNGSGKSNLLSALHLLITPKILSSIQIESLLYENSNDTTSWIEGLFSNERGIFPSTEFFTLKRCFSLGKDEYFLNEKHISHKDLADMFENCGISTLITENQNLEETNLKGDEIENITNRENDLKQECRENKNMTPCPTFSNPFIYIPQNTITRISNLSPKDLYVLLQEISGTVLYEQDKESIKGLLDSTVHSEKKIETFYQTLQTRMLHLKRQRDLLKEYESLEKKKKSIEYKIFKNEMSNIDKEINEIESHKTMGINSKETEIESDSTEENEKSFKLRNYRSQIENLLKKRTKIVQQKENLKNEIQTEFKTTDIKEIEEKETLESITTQIQEIVKKKEKIQEEFKNVKNSLNNLQEEHEESILNLKVMEYEEGFFKVYDPENTEIEIKKTEENLKIKETELKELENKKMKTENKKNLDSEDLKIENYNFLIDKRKSLWRDQKKTKENILSLKEKLTTVQNKVYISCLSYFSYLEIKNIQGIYGCVFELIDIPEDLFKAVESVCRNSLFNVVCENEDVATNVIPKLKNSVTFIPLNRIEINYKSKNIENAVPIDSFIKCDEKFKTVVKMVTKGCYLVSDIKTAVAISRLHNVNTVTRDGDYVSRKGGVSCGIDGKGFLREIRELLVMKDIKEEDLKKIENEISILSEKIQFLDSIETKNSEVFDSSDTFSLRVLILFMHKKIKLLKNGISQSFMRSHKNDLEILKNKIVKIKSMIEENTNFEHRFTKKINEIGDKIRFLYKTKEYFALKEDENYIDAGVEMLRYKITKHMESEYKIPTQADFSSFEFEKQAVRKNILIEKKMNIKNKLRELASFYENKSLVFKEESNEFLYKKLSEINEKLKKYASVNKRTISLYNSCFEQNESICKRIEELKIGKVEIKTFLEELEERSKESIASTFLLLKKYFKIFYNDLMEGNGDLILTENEMKIITHVGDTVMSGGQKTLVALSLLFSIQKIEPSPFYFFDEIDANLDSNSRKKLLSVLKNIESQFIFTTFRNDMLDIGDKFFGVLFSDKKSSVSEIDKSTAKEFLNE
ncbi:Structural maintenance of chromosomes protein 3 [Hamiltosporidium tvaerminnensis]|nr:Structural maintenance of chromosomes protein 3 [Hamiltosporidium tvaerminnensis]